MAPLILLAVLLAADPVPEPAPEVPPDMVRSLKERVVEAIRNCPKAPPGEIVVCSRDRGVAEGYRLPKIADRYDYRGDVESVSRERHRLTEGGETGIGSCSTVGAGGFTGCMLRQWKRAEEQRAGQ